MGEPVLQSELIPTAVKDQKMIKAHPLQVQDKEFLVTCVSMGNPHCLIFAAEPDLLAEKYGPDLEKHPFFPRKTNVEFIEVLNKREVKMRVWERGSGETWACGTGACAVAVAACENGFCKKGEDIKIKLIGGDLIINYTDETVYMTGNAEKVFDGEVEV